MVAGAVNTSTSSALSPIAPGSSDTSGAEPCRLISEAAQALSLWDERHFGVDGEQPTAEHQHDDADRFGCEHLRDGRNSAGELVNV